MSVVICGKLFFWMVGVFWISCMSFSFDFCCGLMWDF